MVILLEVIETPLTLIKVELDNSLPLVLNLTKLGLLSVSDTVRVAGAVLITSCVSRLLHIISTVPSLIPVISLPLIVAIDSSEDINSIYSKPSAPYQGSLLPVHTLVVLPGLISSSSSPTSVLFKSNFGPIGFQYLAVSASIASCDVLAGITTSP